MNKRQFVDALAKLVAAIPLAPRAAAAQRTLLLQESPLAGFQYHAGESVWSLLAVDAALSSAALMAGLTQRGWLFALNARTQVALTVGDLSMFWIFVAIPIGCAGMGLVSVELALRALIGFVRPLEIPPDRSAEEAGQWGV